MLHFSQLTAPEPDSDLKSRGSGGRSTASGVGRKWRTGEELERCMRALERESRGAVVFMMTREEFCKENEVAIQQTNYAL
ncbi:hypothetical protein SKAU_G00188170 [Synaphobranchus kaupii]|uniref:Uncharacterized protein n=1 Tax=Synaphobranchus kaupii TaxID=118154 RepID=A0A9Q1FDH6_SYNKA|nr:hypothetical protein SKAU_G00188170 [Synaphobranchus kaupii]